MHSLGQWGLLLHLLRDQLGLGLLRKRGHLEVGCFRLTQLRSDVALEHCELVQFALTVYDKIDVLMIHC